MGTAHAVDFGGSIDVRALLVVRGGAVVALGVGLVVIHWGLGIPLALTPMLAILAALGAFTIATWYRLRPRLVLGPWAAAAHLSVDVLALTALLYFSGGATNPFATLFLLILALAAVLLPVVHLASVALLTIGAYTLVLFHYQPLHWPAGQAFALHVVGMWFAFVVSAAVVVGFVAALTMHLRVREEEIAHQRERAQRDREVFALGSLAATTAHEIGNPLATIKLLAMELAELPPTPEAGPVAATRLAALQAEIERCACALQRLRVAAHGLGSGCGEPVPVERFLPDLLAQWRERHPEVPVECRWDGPPARCGVRDDGTLSRAIENVIDNAARASPGGIRMDGAWSSERLNLSVSDRGPGLPPQAGELLGHRPWSDRADGLGLGLFLARRVIEHGSGRLRLETAADGGVRALIELPLERLTATMPR